MGAKRPHRAGKIQRRSQRGKALWAPVEVKGSPFEYGVEEARKLISSDRTEVRSGKIALGDWSGR